MINAEDAQKLVAAPLTGREGDRLGTIADVLVDATTGAAQWLVLAAGPYGEDRTLVPADDAELDGNTVRVPYDCQQCAGAPDIDAHDEAPTPTQATQLYRHYGVEQH